MRRNNAMPDVTHQISFIIIINHRSEREREMYLRCTKLAIMAVISVRHLIVNYNSMILVEI